MVQVCKSAELTPMTEEEFAEDERQMLLDYRHRHSGTALMGVYKFGGIN